MTVADLIEKLRRVDPTWKVITCTGDNDDYEEAFDLQIYEPGRVPYTIEYTTFGAVEVV